MEPVPSWALLSGAFLSSSPLEQVGLLWLGLLGLTAVGLVVGYAHERRPGALPIWSLPRPHDQLRHEIIGTAVYHAVALPCFGALVWAGGVRFSSPSLIGVVTTFAACWLWFELWFYLMHRAFHTRALVRFHAWHHASRMTSPMSGFSMSWVEALGWQVGYLLPPVALSALGGVSVEGWALFLAYHWSGNIIGHAGVEIMPAAVQGRALSWLFHPFVYHALHHARWNAHFALYSTFLDRALGTEWPDWPELHQRVLEGRPLTSLKEKGAALAAVPTPIEG